MLEVSPQLVKDLRDRTGAGMMDCKKALAEANGDINVAIDILRKTGITKAEKKSGRSVKEGVIVSKITSTDAVLVEILCETDFIAKNEKFRAYTQEIAAKTQKIAAEGDISAKLNDIEKQTLISMIATIGENIQIRRAIRWTGKCASYLHMGGKIGVMIQVEGEATPNALNDICMHIAAFSPQYVSPEEIPADIIAKEKEIQGAQVTGKTLEMLEKILTGKLSKWYKEVCLNEQPWIRDDKISVRQANPNVKVKKFVRWQVGEEI